MPLERAIHEYDGEIFCVGDTVSIRYCDELLEEDRENRMIDSDGDLYLGHLWGYFFKSRFEFEGETGRIIDFADSDAIIEFNFSNNREVIHAPMPLPVIKHCDVEDKDEETTESDKDSWFLILNNILGFEYDSENHDVKFFCGYNQAETCLESCEKNCEKYYGCHNVASAIDALKVFEKE